MKLRKQIILLGIAFILLTILGWILSDNILRLILNLIPEGIKITAFTPMEVFITSVNISLLFSTIILFPIAFIVFLKFIDPAMYNNEKKVLSQIIFFGGLLFFFGFGISLIAYLKFGLEWFATFNTLYGFETLWSLKDTINTIFFLGFFSGIFFQIPIVLFFLTKYGIIKIKMNKTKRLILIATIFFLIGIITPDGSMFTQLFLGIPIILLIEFSIYWGNKKRKKSIKIKDIPKIYYYR